MPMRPASRVTRPILSPSPGAQVAAALAWPWPWRPGRLHPWRDRGPLRDAGLSPPSSWRIAASWRRTCSALPGEGIKIGLATLDTGRIGIAAQALGIAQAAFEESVRYSKERQQFRKPLSSFQTIQNYLADMATQIDAGRLLIYRACSLKDAGRPSNRCAMAKLFCGELATRVTNTAVQIHGGYGYSKEYDVERYFRDAKVTEIYKGTNEIQRMVISRAVLSRRLLKDDAQDGGLHQTGADGFRTPRTRTRT